MIGTNAETVSVVTNHGWDSFKASCATSAKIEPLFQLLVLALKGTRLTRNSIRLDDIPTQNIQLIEVDMFPELNQSWLECIIEDFDLDM